jgi:hypothetical protein
VLPHLWFLPFPYIYGLRGLFHCIWSAHFSQEHFSFHSKRFMFSQDTTISVRSRGIKPKYALLNFCRVIISVFFSFYFLFLGCYSFGSAYALFPVPCAISTNQKQIGKGFPIYICSLSCALCDLGKSEIEGNLHFPGKLTEI